MLVHGVTWDGPPPGDAAPDAGLPALRLQSASGGLSSVPLVQGAPLGFRVAEGLWCLGHTKIHGPGERTHFPCPDSAPAERGKQCGRCFAREDSRLMHDFHRGGAVPPGLRAYLMQPHWLYAATFANGATKVGTASAPRKWNRLAEQGAVHASYVAHADDGRIVRLLEDLVTSELGIVQLVRASAKAAALLEPRPDVELSSINKRVAASIRELLDGIALGGFSTVEEEWNRPAFADALCGPGRRHAYPAAFDGGEHGLAVESISGGIALATLPGDSGEFVADLGRLKGRRIESGNYRTEIPALQDSLF
ncbi:DUF2797 domain-containing protein [Arthrobacter sp. B2a2-09]|uniref:DUF2797 domain-containing protein n=1 Tax=Arthrobacter sp. B2a2-09 TaxID=2952822 RepID=UPI003FA40904